MMSETDESSMYAEEISQDEEEPNANHVGEPKECTLEEQASKQLGVAQTQDEAWKIFANKFTCIICTEVYKEPAVTNCGHTFCLYCISTYLKSKSRCPSCKELVHSVVPNITITNAVEELTKMMHSEENLNLIGTEENLKSPEEKRHFDRSLSTQNIVNVQHYSKRPTVVQVSKSRGSSDITYTGSAMDGRSTPVGASDCSIEDKTWTKDTTMLLINLRIERDQQFERPACKKKKVWKAISDIIQKTNGKSFTADECSSKWRNLMATYRNNKQKKGIAGTEAIVWPYFEVIDEAFGEKPDFEPPREILVSSSGENVLEESVPVRPTQSYVRSFDFTNRESNHSKRQRLWEQEPSWFQKYTENRNKELEADRQFKRRIWEEQKALERQKITAVKELTSVLKKLCEK